MSDVSSREKPTRQIGVPMRLGLSVVLALVFAGAILFGSGSDEEQAPPPPTFVVVAASEDWLAGEPPGGFELIQVQGPASTFLAGPADLDGQVAAVRVPAGSLVSRAMLGAPDPPRPSDVSLFRIGVNTTYWGPAGPATGDRAVFAGGFGGCAVAILELVSADGGTVLVEADPELAATLGGLPSPVLWKAPDDGWPACGAGEIGDVAAADFSAFTTQATCLEATPPGTWTDNDTDGDGDPSTMPDDGTCST